MKRIALDINNTLRDNLTQFEKCYKKYINEGFELNREEVKSYNMADVFPFNSKDEYNRFVYTDYPYELFGRAEEMDKLLPYRLNDWMQNTLRDVDSEKIPEVFIFSPFEIGLTIQATYSFLSKIGCRCREMYFPTDSLKVWDRCDIMITTNPKLLLNKPEGKTSIKIDMPYNTEVNADYSFESLLKLIEDKDDTIIKLIEA